MNLRVAPQDRELFRLAATAQSETITQFLLEGGRERAERVLADRTEFALDDAAWASVQEAMDRPARVIPELEWLFARPRPE
jgi:uncharacterized protein (DUF1778 family)